MTNLPLALPKMITLIAIMIGLTSCGSGESARNLQIPGLDGPRVVLNNDNVLISMVFENLEIDGGITYPIPEYPNSYIDVSPDLQSGGTLFAFNIAIKDVFDVDFDRLDPLTLPGGRALPGVRTGSLPAVAFNIEVLKDISVYLGPDVFGLFVPVKGIDLKGGIITGRFYSDSLRVGNISLVGEDDAGENSGVLLLLNMNTRTKRMLKKVASN